MLEKAGGNYVSQTANKNRQRSEDSIYILGSKQLFSLQKHSIYEVTFYGGLAKFVACCGFGVVVLIRNDLILMTTTRNFCMRE